ncbi:hypothetical protein ACLOEE_02875 [Limosilactobacillus mucosae]
MVNRAEQQLSAPIVICTAAAIVLRPGQHISRASLKKLSRLSD